MVSRVTLKPIPGSRPKRSRSSVARCAAVVSCAGHPRRRIGDRRAEAEDLLVASGGIDVDGGGR